MFSDTTSLMARTSSFVPMTYTFVAQNHIKHEPGGSRYIKCDGMNLSSSPDEDALVQHFQCANFLQGKNSVANEDQTSLILSDRVAKVILYVREGGSVRTKMQKRTYKKVALNVQKGQTVRTKR